VAGRRRVKGASSNVNLGNWLGFLHQGITKFDPDRAALVLFVIIRLSMVIKS
jgi:hypothetical protein